MFCIAVPHALARLGIARNILFHANDWETAAIALSSKISVIARLVESAKAVLTLHNSYDAALPKQITSRYFSMLIPDTTVLRAFIPLLSGPLTTVSTPFAHELRADPLQRSCFASHLQDVFSRNPPLGIENGAFGGQEPAFSRTVIDKCVSGGYGPLLAEKTGRNAAFWTRIAASLDKRVIGALSRPALHERVPVFFLSGRVDLLQKGFDVIFSAFQRLRRGSARLFFLPNVGGPGAASGAPGRDLDFFRDIALRCTGDIALWPFFLPQEEYKILLRGASFLVMPSLYEPFGAATEGFAAGTPVVARATGGLWIQVAPVAPVYVPPFYGDLLSGSPVRALRLPRESSFANGIRTRFPKRNGATSSRSRSPSGAARRCTRPWWRRLTRPWRLRSVFTKTSAPMPRLWQTALRRSARSNGPMRWRNTAWSTIRPRGASCKRHAKWLPAHRIAAAAVRSPIKC